MVICISNALDIVFVALSPYLWGPLIQIYDRRKVGNVQQDRTRLGRRQAKYIFYDSVRYS